MTIKKHQKHRKHQQHWRRYKSGKYTLINRGIRYRRSRSLEERIRSFGSIPIIRECLTWEDERKAIIRKQDVNEFLERHPKYGETASGLDEIRLYSRSMHPLSGRDARVDFATGRYKNKKIDLFPVAPDRSKVRSAFREEAEKMREKYYSSKKAFEPAIAHELKHFDQDKKGTLGDVKVDEKEALEEEKQFLEDEN